MLEDIYLLYSIIETLKFKNECEVLKERIFVFELKTKFPSKKANIIISIVCNLLDVQWIECGLVIISFRVTVEKKRIYKNISTFQSPSWALKDDEKTKMQIDKKLINFNVQDWRHVQLNSSFGSIDLLLCAFHYTWLPQLFLEHDFPSAFPYSQNKFDAICFFTVFLLLLCCHTSIQF